MHGPRDRGAYGSWSATSKPMIPNDFIQTLLARVDIVEVVDRSVPLKKAGANYVACCPFHSEKTPSFTVSPSKQFYHCFGCGAHGTAIGFLIEYGGKSFPDAVEELARDAGLEVPRTAAATDDARRGQTQDLAGVLLQAAKFYRGALKDAPRAIDYLKQRGLTGPIAARFGIGYAPDSWQPLERTFPDYGDKALETAGLFQSRAAIRTAGKVVVVEGYMDVVALAQHGVEYAVATLGTSTTPVHAQKLFRITDTVVFCFDGDEAGRRAAWRALENTLPVLADGKQARFLFLPDGEDPDDAVRRRGKAAFEAMVESAVPLSEFLLAELGRRSPPSSAEGRAGLVAAAKPLLATLSAPVLAALLRRRLAEIAGLPEAELGALLPVAPVASSRPRAATPTRSAPSLLRDLIKCVLVEPELLRRIDIPRPGEPGVDAEALGALIDFCAGSGGPLTTAGVMQHFSGSPHETVLVAALTAAESDGLSGESLETQLLEGVKHYWMMRQRRSAPPGDEGSPSSVDLSPEEAERARQRRLVQARLTGGT